MLNLHKTGLAKPETVLRRPLGEAVQRVGKR